MNDTMKLTGSIRAAENIRVYVRIRPFNEKEDSNQTCILTNTDKSISIKERDAKQPHHFTFDGIFPVEATQQQVYESVCGEIVNSAFNGINGTIFCYGQTSSGKTYTCVGSDFRSDSQSGIVPRLIKQSLQKIEKNPKNIESKMKISMVEIYNEKIKDLLDISKNDLKIRSNKKEGIFLENMTQKYILTEEIALEYLSIGLQNRSVGATNMNAESSRSHMVVIINLSTHNIYTGEAKSAKLILVDLAGSEKISKTGAEGKILQEAKKINASLTALGKVINALSDSKSTHIPYRDSKLTRFLQQSLGGNSLTKLIVNVSPSICNDCQTLTSFRFGQRAKIIKNEPLINKFYTTEELLALLKKAEQTIQRQNLLIKQLSSKRRTGGYGALSVPPVGTFHLIPDDDDDESEKSEKESQEVDSSCQNKIVIKATKSEESIKKQEDKLIEQQEEDLLEKQKKMQTFTTFPVDFNKEPLLECKNRFSKSADKLDKEQRKATLKFDPSLINKCDEHEGQKSKLGEYLRKKMSEQGENIFINLQTIRQNLLELKARFTQQKRQNSLNKQKQKYDRKIIQRKNNMIGQLKGTKNIHFVR